ncbi:MAG TPA: ModD protein [Sulfurospirillum sp. UBA12182]|nr:MAG TPA: ModD protein [Sulfurospirillum sp. UBA12182]
MFELDDNELLGYIKEDVPYFDITTYIQDASEKRAKLEVFTRDEVVVSCSKEAARIAELLGCEVLTCIPEKRVAKEGEVLLSFFGPYEKVHQAWKLTQVLLEYTCKMATYSKKMLDEIRIVNAHCELLGTRKSFPFAKRLCIKAIMDGGAMPHRLGVSDSVLFFEQHRSVYASDAEFYAQIKGFKTRVPEKKIVVESSEFEDMKALLAHGADVLQLDKIDLDLLKKVVAYRDENFLHVKLLVAGGVNLKNAKEYASTGIDGIVTSALYGQGMANIGTRMSIL